MFSLKRGIGYIICANLVVVIFVGGLINVNPVNAFQSLTVGDQLLYSVDFNTNSDYDARVLYHTDLSPSYTSYWDIDHYEKSSVELHSYTISSVNPSDYDLRHTMNYQDTYRNYNWSHYYYDYFSSNWVWEFGGFDTNLYSGSDTFYDFLNHFNPVLNLDLQFTFPSTTYSYTTSKSYVVNGISNSYTVDVYTFVDGSSGVSNYSYFDIYYDHYSDYSFECTYYVDTASGYLLEYETIYDSQDWGNIDNLYSTSLGTNVTRDYYDNYHTDLQYYLVQTTAGLNPVSDADLPGLEWDGMYDITGYSDYVTAYFWLYDASLMDIEVYLDGIYIETIFGISAGDNFYDIYIGDIPLGYYSHELIFVITDYYDSSHVTEYSIWMSDMRLDWPQINGRSGDFGYEIGTSDTLYWTLNDENYDYDWFEFKFNGTIIDSGTWFNDETLGLNLQTNIVSPGDYLVSIYANDTQGHESYKDLLIHASYSADSTPPTISTPADIYMKPGENKEIIWTISDDNPSSYLVIQNGSIIVDLPWAINNFNVNVSLNTLTLGTWVFKIEVNDTIGNYNYDTIYVYVTEEGTSSTEPTGSNTVTLKAPGLIFAVIGFLSITALTVYVKKSK